MPPSVAQTALVVLIPAAEPVVGPLRLRLDSSASLGVPAHVTVLFPFVPSAAVDRAVLQRIARVIGAVGCFDYTFSRTDWFDDGVLWLAPDDDRPFRRLTAAVHAEFPDHPPFEGEFDGVVPHLTVGHDQPLDVLRRAEDDVRTRLPIVGTATEVVLLAQDEPGGRWHRRASFPLSPP